MSTFGITTNQPLFLAWAFALLDRLASFVFPDGHKNTQPAPANSSETRNCVLVLDASGSMLDNDWKPSRLAAAKEAANTFCDRLQKEQPNASVAIVAFGDGSKIHCNLTKAFEFAKLSKAIDRIRCLGATNMQAGCQSARNILVRYIGTESQVVLLTDGHNTGRSPKEIAKELRQFAVIESVGIGGSPADVDEELLKEISSAYPDGTKRYRWIGDKEKLVEHFHNLAGGITRS